jgi:hypothetical protein
VSGEARDSVRQSARPVIELDSGILAYPPETGGELRDGQLRVGAGPQGEGLATSALRRRVCAVGES